MLFLLLLYAVCEYYAHVDCQDFAVSDCKECATYVPPKSVAAAAAESTQVSIVMMVMIIILFVMKFASMLG